MTAQASTTTPATPADSPLLTRNPMPLSAQQEGQVRDMYYARVRNMCAEEIRIFADCARGKTFSATWKCKNERQAMNKCMIAQATNENMDIAREEWFKQRIEKQRLKKEAEAVEAAARR